MFATSTRVKNFHTKDAAHYLEISHLLNDTLHRNFQATSLYSFQIGSTCSLQYQAIWNQRRSGYV